MSDPFTVLKGLNVNEQSSRYMPQHLFIFYLLLMLRGERHD